MKPLNRKMFRQPGMSRQPMGILASSPELANVVRRRMGQPVQMVHGGYHPPRSPMGRLTTSRPPVPGDVRIPLADLVDRLPKSGFAKPALDRFLASADNIPSSGIAAIRGRATQDALTDLAMQSIKRGGTPFGDSMMARSSAARPDVVKKGQDLAQISSADRSENTGNSFSDIMAMIRDAIPDPKGYASSPAAAKAQFTKSFLGPALQTTPQELSASLQDDPDINVIPDFEVASSSLPDDDLMALKQKDTKAISETPVLLPPPVVDQIVTGTEGFDEDGADMNLIEPTGQNLSNAAKDLLNRPALSAEAVNRRVDQLLGIDSAIQEKTGKPATKKERVQAEIAILKEALGEDAAKDIRTSGAYNLMMIGLMIAAGDSPDAMTNIVKGLAGGLKMYGDAAGEEAQRKNKLEQSLGLQAYSNVREEIAAEKIADARLKEQKASLAGQIYVSEANNTAAMERLVAKEGFDAGRFKKTLKLQTDELKQRLKIAKMPPAEIRTLTTLSQEPQLLEIMEQAAIAKDPTKMERDILGHLIKSPYFAMELAQEGGQQKLAGYATAIADAFRKAREQDSTQAGAGSATPSTLTGAAAQAHIDANAAAKAAGKSTYTIGNQTFGVK